METCALEGTSACVNAVQAAENTGQNTLPRAARHALLGHPVTFTNTTITGAHALNDGFGNGKSGFGIWANPLPEPGQGPAVGSVTFNHLVESNNDVNIQNTTSTFTITVNPYRVARPGRRRHGGSGGPEHHGRMAGSPNGTKCSPPMNEVSAAIRPSRRVSTVTENATWAASWDSPT